MKNKRRKSSLKNVTVVHRPDEKTRVSPIGDTLHHRQKIIASTE
jgi:hypothetical protein